MQSKLPEPHVKLLIKIAAGDHYAFRILFDTYHNKVYQYALRFLRQQVLAEEIVQEVFIKIWLKRDLLESIENFGAYLRVITKNETLNALKKLALDFKLNTAGEKNWTEVDNNTESSIILKDTQALLNKAMEELPKQQKIVYQLCRIEGLKQKEVAERLNISPLTVKTHLREATKTIRHLLGDQNDLMMLIPLLIYLSK
uniref:RNA polymerase sigma factor n=1 Tax=Pedobacter schmidteae TaxID=2201271 RepID=UPI000EB0B8AB|nr:RNA polymerase sigma-70 factor [Pedobacter schmidteae]